MKQIIALSVALTVSGCAGFNPFASAPNPISNTNLYQAELVFDGAIKTFNELKSLCANRTLPPSCRTYVVQGQKIIIKARDADLAAREFVAKNPTIDATTVVSTFTSLVGQFNSTVTNLSATK